MCIFRVEFLANSFFRCVIAGFLIVAVPVAASAAAVGDGPQPDIVFGALSHVLPSVGAVIIGPENPSPGLCTGQLIAPNWVLTAAHCLVDSQYDFVTGDDIASPSATYSSDASYVDPNYNASNPQLGYDDALLHFASPIPLMPLRLNNLQNVVAIGDHVTIIGYGITTSSGISSGRKYSAQTTIASLNTTTLTSASTSGIGQDCEGDAGGAWIVSAADGYSTAVGMFSFGSPACTYSVADQTPSLITFIKTHVSDVCLANTQGAPCDGIFRNTFEALQ